LTAFDIAYVGNDIKGQDRTMRYLYPAAQYNFGLFGNWKIPKARFRFWRNWRKQPPYKKLFEYICRGKIPQEMVPVLRLSRAFDTTPDLWLTLQKNYDLWQAKHVTKAWQMVKPISPQLLHHQG